MKTKEFYFDLPGELIAQAPPNQRGDSRLMVLRRADKSIAHVSVADLPTFLPTGTCMVFNNSRVRKARVFGTGSGRGLVEVLFLETIGDKTGAVWLVLIGKSGSKRPGTNIQLPGPVVGTIMGEQDGAFQLQTDVPITESWFEQYGHLPLPPYIKRTDEIFDAERYQTIYAQTTGSAAAPTAGLHFTPELLGRLGNLGIQQEFIRLDVGLGTFSPVSAENIADHQMHHESYEIDSLTASHINQATQQGHLVLAVGTTSLRALESAWTAAKNSSITGIEPGPDRTNIFIYPGYDFKVATALFTNFHTPASTLFMLVCAFAGTEFAKQAYQVAIEQKYRFFSYGDAMLIL